MEGFTAEHLDFSSKKWLISVFEHGVETSCDLTGQIVKRCDFSNGNTGKHVVNSVICKLLVDLSHIERWISHIHGQDGKESVIRILGILATKKNYDKTPYETGEFLTAGDFIYCTSAASQATECIGGF